MVGLFPVDVVVEAPNVDAVERPVVELELGAFLVPGKMIAQVKTAAATTTMATARAKRRRPTCLRRWRSLRELGVRYRCDSGFMSLWRKLRGDL